MAKPYETRTNTAISATGRSSTDLHRCRTGTEAKTETPPQLSPRRRATVQQRVPVPAHLRAGSRLGVARVEHLAATARLESSGLPRVLWDGTPQEAFDALSAAEIGARLRLHLPLNSGERLLPERSTTAMEVDDATGAYEDEEGPPAKTGSSSNTGIKKRIKHPSGSALLRNAIVATTDRNNTGRS